MDMNKILEKMEASAQSEIMRGGPKQSLRQKMPKEENIAWQHNTGGNKKGNLLDKRERKLCKDRNWRDLAKGNVAPTMRRTIRYLGSVKQLFTFYVLCLKIRRRRRLDIQITTLLERLCLCIFFFGVFYPVLPMLLVGKSMFYTWSSSKISFHPCFNLVILGLQCFFISPPCSFLTLS